MKLTSSAIAAAFFVTSVSVGSAADYSVSRSVSISAPPHEVWQAIGDFCDIDDWHPAIATCALKAQDGTVHRLLTLKDGGEFLEKLVAVDPAGPNYTYSIVSSPMPLTGYTATLSVTAGDPSTVTWSGRFSSDDPGMEAVFGGIYDAGLAEIEARFSQ